jgi:hypothetical protein
MNIKTLSKRIKKLEKNKIKEGIPDWCIEETKRRASLDSLSYRFLMSLPKNICREEEVRPRPWSNEEIKQFTIELSEKYSSYEEYAKSRPPMDLKKLQDTIARQKKSS